MSVKQLLNCGNIAKIWIVSRYFYKIGDPIITDETYELYTNAIKKHKEASKALAEYLNRTYDDDPIPVELLKQFDIEVETNIDSDDLENYQEKEKYFKILNEDKSLSCHAVTSYDEAWEFFEKYKRLDKDLVVSLKMDGINTKNIYDEGDLKISLSRGRASESFDFTKQTKLVLPNRIDLDTKDLKITGESFVTYEGVSKLRETDPNKYKTCKSSAISMLRVRHPLHFYKYLKTVIFSAEGIESTLDQTFKKLKMYGFDVVPYKLIQASEIPDEKGLFQHWLKENVFDYMWEFGKDMPSDGVVVEVNDLTFNGTINGQYSDRQIALKFEQWSYNIYTGIVKNIIWRQNRVHASIRVEIEPMETVDGCTATIINVFNPSILITNKIQKGSIIHFERNSDAVNILVQESRLKDKLKSGAKI